MGGDGIRRGAWGPAAGGVEQLLVDAVDEVVAQDRGDRDTGCEQTAGHQHKGGSDQCDP